MSGRDAALSLLAYRRTALAALECVPRSMRDWGELDRARRLYEMARIRVYRCR